MRVILKVGIINVTGYAGSELARILFKHPEVEITSVTGRSAAGKKVPEVLPHLSQMDIPITATIEESVDFVFSTLPSGTSAEILRPFIVSGVPSVDIAADFRIHDPDKFKNAYKLDHPTPELLKNAVYGLPEIHRDQIKKTSLVANPGCFPEASLLALAPAVKSGLVLSDLIIDAKTGISGAGRGGLATSSIDHFAEADENVLAYGLTGHGHQPEILQELTELAGNQLLKVTFVPHRVPMSRGIMATCYATLSDQSVTNEDMIEIYRSFYQNEPFVKVTDFAPQTKYTTGSNMCLVFPVVDRENARLIVVSCLDNLVKGAAGQAVQNMNLMSGLPETEGLGQLPLYP